MKRLIWWPLPENLSGDELLYTVCSRNTWHHFRGVFCEQKLRKISMWTWVLACFVFELWPMWEQKRLATAAAVPAASKVSLHDTLHCCSAYNVTCRCSVLNTVGHSWHAHYVRPWISDEVKELVCTRTNFPVAEFQTIKHFVALIGALGKEAIRIRGRQMTVGHQDMEDRILDDVAEHPGISTRNNAAAGNVAHSTVWRVSSPPAANARPTHTGLPWKIGDLTVAPVAVCR
jgi:hypothetical protein